VLFSSQELRRPSLIAWVRENFHFLTTHTGRAMFLLFAGNLLWLFGKAGIVPALLTCANSAFNLKFESIASRFD